MGVTRKLLSMTTVGLVDFRSDKERIARSTRLSHHELRRQTELMEAQAAGVEPPPPRPGITAPAFGSPRPVSTQPMPPAQRYALLTVAWFLAVVFSIGVPYLLILTVPLAVWSIYRAVQLRKGKSESKHRRVE